MKFLHPRIGKICQAAFDMEQAGASPMVAFEMVDDTKFEDTVERETFIMMKRIFQIYVDEGQPKDFWAKAEKYAKKASL